MALAASHKLCPETASEEEALIEDERRPSTTRWSRSARGLVAVFGLVGLAALLWAGAGGHHGLLAGRADIVVRFNEAISDPCSQYPFISLLEVLHSNLGNQGPDSGDEGIVYRAQDLIPGQEPVDLLMVVNASSSYQAGHAKYNGIHGKYGLITLKAGNEADFTFKFLDAKTRQPKRLEKQEFTFFDLDQHANDENREYILVEKPSNVWLTKNSELQQIHENGKTKFMSSTMGNGRDNPKDPTALTVQQKNRAVTLEFENFQELNITLGCTPGNYARYFMFVARPSLLCAQTVGSAENGEDKAISQVDTTVAPTVAPTTLAPIPDSQNCLFTIVTWCFPKFWEQWGLPFR
mmetsp:Transcript_51177/g.118951  ORF Transcript_51177/g.118951 Transcript_51177/m.118951 type:complete len:350 (+) Transcript_51177:71-1120(+)